MHGYFTIYISSISIFVNMLLQLWLRGRAVVLQPEGRQFNPSLLHLHAEPELPLIEKYCC